MIAHAGMIAAWSRGAWRGALIQGPSGSGKSDLALRAMEAGFRLVADDRVLLFVSQGSLFGRAPDSLHGLIEARGCGVLRENALRFAPVTLSVRCKMAPDRVERFPEENVERWLGCATPVLDLWPFENSATAKIRRAIEHLGARS